MYEARLRRLQEIKQQRKSRLMEHADALIASLPENLLNMKLGDIQDLREPLFRILLSSKLSRTHHKGPEGPSHLSFFKKGVKTLESGAKSFTKRRHRRSSSVGGRVVRFNKTPNKEPTTVKNPTKKLKLVGTSRSAKKARCKSAKKLISYKTSRRVKSRVGKEKKGWFRPGGVGKRKVRKINGFESKRGALNERKVWNNAHSGRDEGKAEWKSRWRF